MSENSTSKIWYKKPIFYIPIGLILLWLIFSDTFRTGVIGFIMILVYLGFWGGVIYGVVWLIKKKLKASKELNNQKLIEKKELQKEIFDEFKLLGDTPEEREKEIKHIFDKKEVSILFADYYDFNARTRNNQGNWYNYDGYVAFRIHRNLAAMEEREREFLRSTLLLYNRGVLNDSQYKYYLFAFINGNGKASIDYWRYSAHSEENIKDGGSCVNYYQSKIDGSVDQAINHLLPIMNNVPDLNKRIRGGGSWLSSDEIPQTIFNQGGEYSIGLGNLEDSDTLLEYSGEGSLITVAPPGSGKTQCFVIPNLLRWKGAAVVLDIKGEIYEATSKWRSENVGKIYKFSPLDPKNSSNYNPLTFVRNDPDFIWEDSRFLADMMIVPSGASDPFWENMARDVLTSAIAYISFNNDIEERAMSKVIDIIYGLGWDEMVISLKTNVLISSMRRMGNTLDEMEKKQRESILKTAQSSLSAWSGERIAKVTDKSDWNPLDLRNGTPTIYICVNPNEVESYLSIIRVFIAQHIRMLASELPKHGTPPVLFMLDELPRLKKMPPVDEALNIGRQYGIKLWMFAQSYGQLKDAYPDPEGLIGSCVIRTFMNLPLNDEFTTKISDQLGYREGPLDTSRQKLVEPLELAGPNYRDYILVFATGTKPAKVHKKFAYQDEELKLRMNKN